MTDPYTIGFGAGVAVATVAVMKLAEKIIPSKGNGLSRSDLDKYVSKEMCSVLHKNIDESIKGLKEVAQEQSKTVNKLHDTVLMFQSQVDSIKSKVKIQ